MDRIQEVMEAAKAAIKRAEAAQERAWIATKRADAILEWAGRESLHRPDRSKS